MGSVPLPLAAENPSKGIVSLAKMARRIGWLLLLLLASTQSDNYLKATPDGVVSVQTLDPLERLVAVTLFPFQRTLICRAGTCRVQAAVRDMSSAEQQVMSTWQPIHSALPCLRL